MTDVPDPPSRHQARAPQHAELLRQVRRLDPDERLHLADRSLAVDQQLERSDPGRMRQAP